MIDLVTFRETPLPAEEEIMTAWQGEYDKPLVSVLCMTFNQELYIEDAIRGFLIQKTNFPFEIIIHDDASTDSTAKIIKRYAEKYPKIIKTILQQENQYSKAPNSVLLISAKYSKGDFIALCEGDDFWTNETKIQKQIQIINANPACSLVVHNCYTLNKNNEFSIFRKINSDFHFNPSDILDVHAISAPTASYFFRRSLFEHIPDWFKFAPVGDLVIELYASKLGNGIFLQEPHSVYRVQAANSWSSRIYSTRNSRLKIYKELISMFDFFIKDFPQFEEKINVRKAALYKMLARQVCDKSIRKSFTNTNIVEYKSIREKVKSLKCLTLLRFHINFPSSLAIFNVIHLVNYTKQYGVSGFIYFYKKMTFCLRRY